MKIVEINAIKITIIRVRMRQKEKKFRQRIIILRSR